MGSGVAGSTAGQRSAEGARVESSGDDSASAGDDDMRRSSGRLISMPGHPSVVLRRSGGGGEWLTQLSADGRGCSDGIAMKRSPLTRWRNGLMMKLTGCERVWRSKERWHADASRLGADRQSGQLRTPFTGNAAVQRLQKEWQHWKVFLLSRLDSKHTAHSSVGAASERGDRARRRVFRRLPIQPRRRRAPRPESYAVDSRAITASAHPAEAKARTGAAADGP